MEYTPRRKLAREFKLEAVRQVALSEKPKAQLARELGVRVGQLRTWRLEFDTKLAMDALNMAIAHRGPPVTLHSDQGSTYATGSYREIVNRYGIRQSMSRKGDCWDTQYIR